MIAVEGLVPVPAVFGWEVGLHAGQNPQKLILAVDK